MPRLTRSLKVHLLVGALIGPLANNGVTYAQAPPPVVYPPPAYPPPAYPPPAYPPPVYSPAPPPMAPSYVPTYNSYRTMSRVFTGVGVPLLVLGFLAVMAGIPIAVLTYAEKICEPSPTRSCSGYYTLSWGLLGGGAALMISGIVLTAIGRAFRIRSAWAGVDFHGPRLGLLPAPSGGVGGAAASLDFTF